jgi:hypothetical protein
MRFHGGRVNPDLATRFQSLLLRPSHQLSVDRLPGGRLNPRDILLPTCAENWFLQSLRQKPPSLRSMPVK